MVKPYTTQLSQAAALEAHRAGRHRGGGRCTKMIGNRNKIKQGRKKNHKILKAPCQHWALSQAFDELVRSISVHCRDACVCMIHADYQRLWIIQTSCMAFKQTQIQDCPSEQEMVILFRCSAGPESQTVVQQQNRVNMSCSLRFTWLSDASVMTLCLLRASNGNPTLQYPPLQTRTHTLSPFNPCMGSEWEKTFVFPSSKDMHISHIVSAPNEKHKVWNAEGLSAACLLLQ